jgi:membrane peptidoglycan carboxypeptidase
VRNSSTLHRVALATALCLLGGVLLAGLAFPAVGGLGLLGKGAADEFLTLPASLKTPPLAQRSRILDVEGHVLATLYTENRVRVRLSQVPVPARQALIAIEDNRFYAHNGIDVKGTLRALARNTGSGSVQQGGSTLTQQYVKNVLVESARTRAGQEAAVEKSVQRKMREARYALELERTMDKDEILEGYLNIAYFGNGVYGIGTAANHYWGIPVTRLSLAQGALLAGMVQNPSRFDPKRNPKDSVARRNRVLDRMVDLDYLDASVAAVAKREPLQLKLTSVKSGCEAPGVSAPFFCDYVRRYLERGPAGEALGETLQERQEALLAGGLTIRTTLDPTVQASAQKAVDQQVPHDDPFGAAAVVDVVEPGTGAVRAMAVDRGFGEGKHETKVNLALGGDQGFQGGSTFKVFTLAQALQKGISPQLKLYAPQSYCPKAYVYVLDDGGCPGNAGDSEFGTYTMVKATWESVNTYFLQLAERTGLEAPIALAEAMGVRDVVPGSFEGKPFPRFGSFVLGGAGGASPLAMAAAYATFAARGQYCPPTPVVSITDSQGKQIELPESACEPLLEPAVADQVNAILRGVIDGPHPGRTGRGASIGRPAAGKTGTTNNSKAAWFVGYTPQLCAAVWVGKTTPTSMRGVRINGRYYRAVYGGSLPAPIWRQAMLGALKGVAKVNFVGPSKVDTGTLVPVPDVSGLRLADAEQQLRDLGFGVTLAPAVNARPIPAGAAAGTRPSAGTPTPAGSTIVLVPSNGLAPLPSPTPTPSPTPSPTKPGGNPHDTPTPSTEPSPTPSPTKPGNAP